MRIEIRALSLLTCFPALAIWGAGIASDAGAGNDWWSFQPIKSPEPPAVKQTKWPVNTIDRFVLAKLEANGLRPSPPADRTTLIRRLYFDLIGLPPTPEEVEAYVSDRSDRSYDKLVDRLLASPHYGERWARHWLDVIRFGESQGFERNKLRPNAWKFRDWVVEALNSDMPYDEFVRLQVAGDVLRPSDPLAVVASGFLVAGPYDLTTYTDGTAMMRAAAREEEVEGLVGTASQAFLGLTVNCARCHDHKFDPITQREYYQIAATLGGTYHGEERESLHPEGKSAAESERAKLAERIEVLRKELAALETGANAKLAKSAKNAATTSRVSRGLQVFYRFADSDRSSIRDLAGAGPPLDLSSEDRAAISPGGEGLSIRGTALLTTAAPAARVIDACRAANALTLEAWITPANTTQEGPARILSISSGTGERNATLAQVGWRYDVRLRTTATDPNGIPSTQSAEDSAIAKPTHVVFTRDSTGTARFYLNGKVNTEAKVAGDFSNWSSGFRLAVANETTRDRPWQGVLHLAAVYNTALTPAEVAINYRAVEARILGGAANANRIVEALPPTARLEHDRLTAEIGRLETRARLLAGGPAHLTVPKAPGVFHVLARGDYREKREPVKPSGLAVLKGLPTDWGLREDAPEADRRKALAAWLSSPKNPLTARVMVNRLWAHHFGAGLVATPSDFGRMGDRPSHPELLDWLANELINPTDDGRRMTDQSAVGSRQSAALTHHSSRSTHVNPSSVIRHPSKPWTLKRIHRLIVLSATYRQASINQQSAIRNPQSIDPGNRLLWRQNPRRLEAEAVRDSVLWISGGLNRAVGGPGFRDWTVKSQGNNEIYTVIDASGPEFNRRTLYRMVVRAGTSPLLDTLDCPDPSVATPRRTATTTPLQALSLLNSAFMERSAARFAERLMREVPNNLRGQIALAYRLAFAREATSDEIRYGIRFADAHGLQHLCMVLINLNEFHYVE